MELVTIPTSISSFILYDDPQMMTVVCAVRSMSTLSGCSQDFGNSVQTHHLADSPQWVLRNPFRFVRTVGPIISPFQLELLPTCPPKMS